MTMPNFQALVADLSAARLRAMADGPRMRAEPAHLIAWHLFNAAIGKALYPTLQILELGLRNRIDQALQRRFSDACWASRSISLSAGQHARLAETRAELARFRRPACAHAIVSHLPLGFWTAFFNKHHCQTGLGHWLAKDVFRLAPRTDRNTRAIDQRLTNVRNLRNRVFHHERLVNRPELLGQHRDLRNLIRWMGNDLDLLASKADQFTRMHENGVEPWLDRLAR
ncbi:MAG: hypothetical protein EBU75_10555 [Betaproteobacteria bacterium]|nr:hypothetical protein [Betaproteobacteria bacterium]